MSTSVIPPHAPARYLLVPSMPTPNGRLHLGHIAGPFLKLDVLARYLRSRGDQAWLMSGADCYESHVALRAGREGRTCAEVARGFSREIQHDLAAMRIECDTFADPLEPADAAFYDRANREMIERLVAVGAARPLERRFPYTADGRFIPGSHLAGACPACDRPASGYVCEACGHQFRSDTLRRATLRDAEPIPAWRTVRALSMRVRDPDRLLAAVDHTGLPARFRGVVAEHVHRFGGELDLTIPGDWGVGWGALDGVPQIVFTYATAYPFSLALGEMLARSLGDLRNTFDPASDVRTVVSFGFDVTIAFVFATLGISQEMGTYRAFDHYLGNEFFTLHGEKFSTSRGHVIWSADWVERTPATADLTRYYLSRVSPDDRVTDFSLDAFLAAVNEQVLGRLAPSIDACMAALRPESPAPPSEAAARAIDRAFRAQDERFDPARFRLAAIPGLVDDWAAERAAAPPPSAADAYWHLKLLALLAAPLMPDFAIALWATLGADGAPTRAAFERPTAPLGGRPHAAWRPLTRRDLAPGIPAALAQHLTQEGDTGAQEP